MTCHDPARGSKSRSKIFRNGAARVCGVSLGFGLWLAAAAGSDIGSGEPEGDPLDFAKSVLLENIGGDGNAFRLTNITDRPEAGGLKMVSGVLWLIEPPGGVVPGADDASPLQILPDSTGFDPEKLDVILGEKQLANGEPVQGLGLLFHEDGGLRPGGVLNFRLSVMPGLSEVNLVPELATGRDYVASPTPDPNPVPDPVGENPAPTPEPVPPVVPEPATALAWAVAGAALAIRMRIRRARDRDRERAANAGIVG